MLIISFCAFCFCGCGSADNAQTPENADELNGILVVYHAGSLSVPFKALEAEFEQLHPDVDVQLTAGGSRKIARRVSELGDNVDILASADYTVIDTLMIPDYAKWNAWFGRNSMVIMYTKNSQFADEISKDNWYEILLRDGINYGHSEPNADPCGYRTVLSWQLAEQKYEKPGLSQQLTDACPEKNIRPKSVELISMLETGALDYAFEYESVARQHQQQNDIFEYVELPGKVNLSDVKHTEFYKENSSIELSGTEPGTTVTKVGEPIVYGITMPTTGENPELAKEFLKFFFDREQGLKILEDNGQPVLDEITLTGEGFPAELNSFIE